MTPDQYAWGALREYTEQGLLLEQAYTNAWKFAVAVDAAARILDIPTERFDESSRTALKRIQAFVTKNFGVEGPTPTGTARRLLAGISSFNLEAFGFGLGPTRDQRERVLTPQVTDLLLEAVNMACTNMGIIAAADKLDDSWDGSKVAKSLLIGLLKATKEINDRYSRNEGLGIHVLSFLRSDIYSVLQFDDKDKHRAIEKEIT